jgi:hypothetical protein
MITDADPGVLVERFISCYEGDRLVLEFILDNVPLEELRKILGSAVNPADPMLFDSYPLDRGQLEALAKYSRKALPERLDAGWSLFVEATQAHTESHQG